MHCYYCNTDGLRETKRCPKKRSDKDPCDKYKKYLQDNYGKIWKPQKQKTKGKKEKPTMGVMNGKSTKKKKRFIALTKFRIKVNETWTEPVICIADSGGCENGINAAYARRSGLDIFRLDPSEYTEAQVTMVDGTNIEFLEYVDIPCDFAGEVIEVRYFLVEKLHRTLLLGCPFHDEYDAVSRIRTGEFKIHDLGVNLKTVQI